MLEREYYQLADLAERWACEVDDLLHLSARGQAQICANLHGMTGGVRICRPRNSAGPDDLDLVEYSDVASPADTVNAEIMYAPTGVYVLDGDTLRLFEKSGNPEVGIDHGWTTDWLLGTGWECYTFDPPVVIGISRLCMLHGEMKRVEREIPGLRLAPRANATPPDEDPPASERRREEGRPWTREELAALDKDRKALGTKAASKKWEISQARIRKLLPGEKSAPALPTPANPFPRGKR